MTILNTLSILDPDAVQRDVLLHRVVRPNCDSEFGRRHGFSSIWNVSDFRSAVPVCRYDDLRHDVERMKHGEAGVLVSEPVRRFFVTSGSTSEPKYVPVASSFIREKWQAFQTYWSLIREHHPETLHGTWITNFSDNGREQQITGGCLFSSESSFWTAWSRGADCRAQNPLSHSVSSISDHDARYYAIARVLLIHDVSLLMSLNPSTILRLFETMERHLEPLLSDLDHAGLSTEFPIEPEVRSYITARCEPQPHRASQLRAVITAAPPQPLAQLWPGLVLGICWRSPMVRPYIDLLRRYMGSVPQRDYLMMASEGVLAIPFEDEVSGGALAVRTHFFEFIPEDQAEVDDPSTLLASELETGRNYSVVLSNSAGLYRYHIGDVVRVRGFLGRTPVLEFLHRVGHTCSLTGEKLTEEQVVGAVSTSASSLQISFRAYTVCPIAEPYPHYAVVAELIDGCDGAKLAAFPSAFDSHLGCRNLEYQSKRQSRRLGPPELCLVRPGSYADLQITRARTSTNDAQVKIPCLTRDQTWISQFDIMEKHNAA